MDEDYVFSEHALRRLNERSSFSPEEVNVRLAKRVPILISETLGEPSFRYYVLWDSRKDAPLLLIACRQDISKWVVVTVYATMTYHKRGHNIMVMPLHIEKARKREIRFVNEGHPRGAAGMDGFVRLHIIVRYTEYGQPKVRRYKIGSVPAKEFVTVHQKDATKLVNHFIEIGKMKYISVPANAKFEAEVLKSENNTLTILSQIEF